MAGTRVQLTWNSGPTASPVLFALHHVISCRDSKYCERHKKEEISGTSGSQGKIYRGNEEGWEVRLEDGVDAV